MKGQKMNKSEELAKLLGIDVMYYAGIGGVYNKERYIAVFGKDAFNRQIMEYDDNEYTVKLIYPDFTKPSNFVKLLKLFVSGYATACCFTDIDEYDIIQNCIDFIRENGYTRYCRNKFKQQAQQTEWKY